MPDRIVISGLAVDTVIGLYAWERLVRQSIQIDLELTCDLHAAGATDRVEDTVDYKTLTNAVRARVSSSRFLLIEALACDVAETCLDDTRVKRARVTVHKLGALRHAQNVAVVVEREQGDERMRPPHRAYIGVGSNVDAVTHVQNALQALHDRFGALRVSPVYRTRAVGSDGAADFLNAAVEIRTSAGPHELRDQLHEIEAQEGRERTSDRNAPRTLDLDLLLYDDLVHSTAEHGHALPDPGIEESAFVLVPLADVARPIVHPVLGVTIGQLRDRLPRTIDGIRHFKDEVLY